MAKKLWYLTLDTETATLPIVNEVARNSEEKKKLAIAKPLVYDIGWVIHGRLGDIRATRQFLVAEIFSVPSVFNTAYYREKRPLYIEMLRKKETEIKPWREIIEILIEDIKDVDFVCAYNARFDFKKAIPFTELYIDQLYSDHYFEWEKLQKTLCVKMLTERPPKKTIKETKEAKETFNFRGEDYAMVDIWGQACAKIINTYTYKKNCIDNGMLSESGEFFKTSAESAYRYLVRKFGFEEAHTALADAIIETFILSKIAKKGKIEKGIIDFPFNLLGRTHSFLREHFKKLNGTHFEIVIEKMAERAFKSEAMGNYEMGLARKIIELEKFAQKNGKI